jgi:hypothetical protein
MCEIWYTYHVHTHIVYMNYTHLIVDNFFIILLNNHCAQLYCGQYLNLLEQKKINKYYHIFFDPAHNKNPSNISERLIWDKTACANITWWFFTFCLGRNVQALLHIFILEIMLPSVVSANHYLPFCCILHCLFPLI